MNGADAPAHGEIAVDVAIVGAGPAGLTAGYLLAKAGKRVAIVEKDPACVGGLSRTVEHDGFRFDLGGHGISSQSPAIAELLNEILPGGFSQHPRSLRVYREGKLYSYPPRLFEAVGNLGLRRALACLASYGWARLFPIKEVTSAADWISNRFGRELHAIFFKGYAEKLWGSACERISADWAAQRLGGVSLRSAADDLQRPRLGAGTVWQTARDRIVERGGMVLMGCSLKQLASDGQGGWRMTATGPSGEVAITAGQAISSAPIRELAARLYPLPVSTIEASRLRHRDLVTVALMVRGNQPFPGDCLYIGDSKVQAARARSLCVSPPGEDVACVALDYFCSEGDGLWSMRDDRLIELAGRELGLVGLTSPGEVMGGAVARLEKAYPICDQTYAAHVVAVHREIADKHPTLHLVGRNGMHRCSDLDQAMLSAMLTVENILAGRQLHDPWSATEDTEYRENAQPALPVLISDERGVEVATPRELPPLAESEPRRKVA